MESRECLDNTQLGCCGQKGEPWLFQSVDLTEAVQGEPVRVALKERGFHHDEDEELH